MHTLAIALKKIPEDTSLGKMVSKAEKKQASSKKRRGPIGHKKSDIEIIRRKEKQIFQALNGKDNSVASFSSLEYKPGKMIRFQDRLARVRGGLLKGDCFSLVISYETPRKIENSEAHYNLELVNLDKEGDYITLVK